MDQQHNIEQENRRKKPLFNLINSTSMDEFPQPSPSNTTTTTSFRNNHHWKDL